MTNSDKTVRKKGAAKQLREQAIVSKAMTGLNSQEIANELGITRQTVSLTLNSQEVKEKIKEIDQKLAKGIDDAIECVLRSVKTDYQAARDLLKNYGSMKVHIDMNHQFPKPTVIKRRNGDIIVIGTEADLEDKNGSEENSN